MTTLRILLVVGLLSAGAATAGTITITLDDVTTGTCGTPWVEAGCSIWFSETTAEDATPGFCLVVADAGLPPSYEGVYIYPGRVVVDLSNVAGVESVEVDVYETHFAGSTRAFLYDDTTVISSTQSYQENHQTLMVMAGGNTVDRFAVSAHECYVFEIRIIGDEVADAELSSFGELKALFR